MCNFTSVTLIVLHLYQQMIWQIKCTQVEIEIKRSCKLRSWVCIQDLNLLDRLISIWTSVKCGDFAAVIALCYSQAAKQPLLSHVGIRVKVITFKNDQQVSRIRCFAWPDPWTIVIMKQNCNNAGHSRHRLQYQFLPSARVPSIWYENS